MAPQINSNVQTFIFVLAASFAGSLHCVGMCGGILFALPPGRQSQYQYHIGRLIGYLGLAFIFGWVGKSVFQYFQSPMISLIAAVLISFFMIWTGARAFKGLPVHLPLPNVISRVFKYKDKLLGSFFIGLFTPFIPCGWLHAFLLGSTSLASPHKSMLIILAFWLGTIPALAFGSKLIDKILLPFRIQTSKVIAITLITFGLITVSAKTTEFLLKSKTNNPIPMCNSHNSLNLFQDNAACNK